MYCIYHTMGQSKVNCCVSDTSSTVTVSLNMLSGQYYVAEDLVAWKMELQRYTGGKWKTIASRTGQTTNSSPTSRTFTNIKKQNKPMRVKMVYNRYNFGAKKTPVTRYSKYFVK